MFYKKKGLPGESELVICIVKKVLPHSVFVNLEEYENLEGMIHMSEISPGRIRNIRDYVVEGKKLVCKVLGVNRHRGTIDLSLRRVPMSQRNAKNEAYKQEEKSEKILELVGKNLKTNLTDVYEKAGAKILENYGSLTKTFYSIVKDEVNLSEIGIPEKYVKELVKIVKEKIKIPEVTITGTLILRNEKNDGVERIKKILIDSGNFAVKNNYNIKFRYVGAPNYKVEVISPDFKTAEKALKEITEKISSDMEKAEGTSEFKR